MSRSVWAVFLAAIFGLAGNVCATTNGAVSVKLKDIPVGKVIKVGELSFVKVGEEQYMMMAPGCNDGLTVGGTKDFAYTGTVQEFIACAGHTYKLEVWGAQGGTTTYSSLSLNTDGGLGGYSVGEYSPTVWAQLYVVVGGRGGSTTSTAAGSAGYNGGAVGGTGNCTGGGGGGGATHIASATGLLSTLSANKTSVIIVAGAGGGAGGARSGKCSSCSSYQYNSNGYAAGIGGGESGTNGQADSRTPAGGGTQTGGGTAGKPIAKDSGSGYTYWPGGGGGGGAGWYGGGGGAGGSSSASAGGEGKAGNFGVGGAGGVGAASSNYPNGHGYKSIGSGGAGGSGYISSVLFNAKTNVGNTSFPSTSGGTETGHTGNGYARITRVK